MTKLRDFIEEYEAVHRSYLKARDNGAGVEVLNRLWTAAYNCGRIAQSRYGDESFIVIAPQPPPIDYKVMFK